MAVHNLDRALGEHRGLATVLSAGDEGIAAIGHTARVQPGWYPDPYSRDLYRWWDGAAWTPHTAPMHPVGTSPSPGHWPAAPDSQTDLAEERSAGRRASIAVLVVAALNAAQLIIGAAVSAPLIHHSIDQIRAVNRGERTTLDLANERWTPVVNALSLLALAAQILFFIWFYRAATVAQRAGLPARRRPMWAVLGFFIPVVNLWFPYQVARDAFPPGDPASSVVGRWWAWWLTQVFVGLPIIALSFVSVPVAVLLACAAAVVPFLAARQARAMIAALDGTHHQLLGR